MNDLPEPYKNRLKEGSLLLNKEKHAFYTARTPSAFDPNHKSKTDATWAEFICVKSAVHFHVMSSWRMGLYIYFPCTSSWRGQGLCIFKRKFIKWVFVEPGVCIFHTRFHATVNIKLCAGYACNETGCDGSATAANPSWQNSDVSGRDDPRTCRHCPSSGSFW